MNLRSIARVFALAVAIGASSSHAVTLNPRGLGQVLIYPYYTVNKQQSTLVSIVNTSDVGKAVTFRVLEGYNGRDTMDVDVFLSPHDVWTASLQQISDDGGAKLVTADKSCTYPAIPAEGIALSSAAFDGAAGSLFPQDTGPTSITRTREGSIELFALGDIIPGSDLDIATRHVQNGTPDAGIPACTDNLLTYAAVNFLSAPSNGLSGSAAIVNVGQGTFFGYNAAALSGFSDLVLAGRPSIPFPTLRAAYSPESSVPGGAVAYVSTDSGRPLALDYALGIDAVSAVFTADAIYNEYLVDAQLGAQTDWVVTFPTKAFYVDPFFVGSEGVMAPFVETFGASSPGQSNVHFDMTVYDREEGVLPQVSGVPDVAPPALPYQVNVVSFAAPGAGGAVSPVLGSHLVSAYLPPFGADGWARIDLASGDGGHRLRPDAKGAVFSGLPVTGFMVYNIINAQAQPGMLANYGGVFPHRSTISCNGQAAPAGAAVCP
jgi:hypothetical protein